ncbi:phage tail sheath subtilisin-like domain-containing protein [Paenibacillus farraposensis]|uniref:Phage tail sheath subtilisin-like domain-containing protein n=1 Tax=Paenibacillus farraposensis TaxID=2807095 RepID=A0ABW4DIX4_9BACL|nr:phage tail sheath subtilisin-like domain-containing protein [Paenibacillus farraposensis]
MAGTWVTQNEDLPGVYTNVVSEPKPLGTLSDRGVVTLPLTLSWGPVKQIITIDAGDDISKALGYDITHTSLLLVKEALKRAKTLLVYRLNQGTKATVTSGNLVATAKYDGVRGNDISIVIQSDIDTPTIFNVRTLVEGKEMDAQKAADIDGLVANDWVTFKASGTDKTLVATAGAPLTGGTDGTAINADHSDYMAAIETQDFNTVGVPYDDATLKPLYTTYVNRLRNDEGKNVQVVLPNYSAADSEGVINVTNGVILSDGTVIDKVKAVAWVAAATAAANVNESLTYADYDDAVDVDVRFTNREAITGVQSGQFFFIYKGGKAKVQQDINTFRSFTPKKNKDFRKNRVIRTLDGIKTDLQKVFEKSYIGKVDNNADGRNIVKKEAISLFELNQQIGAIEEFNPQTDVTIVPGTDKDAIYAEYYVKPVDSIEKIYQLARAR